jgi:carbon monoxide dehydrogenase subunit G
MLGRLYHNAAPAPERRQCGDALTGETRRTMAITLRETFQLDAPIERVWDFLLDPHDVVTCMPGAALDEVVDDRTFLGSIRVKVGPIVTSYKGRVQFVEVDAAGYRVEMLADGRETSGSGNARATMASQLARLPGGGTEVVAEAQAEITGRVMQFGQGMIEGVSHQLFLDFVKRTRERLDAAPGAGPVAAPGAAPDQEPISAIGLLLRTLWAAIKGAWRRLIRLVRRNRR